jgi:hypothetical protein
MPAAREKPALHGEKAAFGVCGEEADGETRFDGLLFTKEPGPS